MSPTLAELDRRFRTTPIAWTGIGPPATRVWLAATAGWLVCISFAPWADPVVDDGRRRLMTTLFATMALVVVVSITTGLAQGRTGRPVTSPVDRYSEAFGAPRALLAKVTAVAGVVAAVALPLAALTEPTVTQLISNAGQALLFVGLIALQTGLWRSSERERPPADRTLRLLHTSQIACAVVALVLLVAAPIQRQRYFDSPTCLDLLGQKLAEARGLSPEDGAARLAEVNDDVRNQRCRPTPATSQ